MLSNKHTCQAMTSSVSREQGSVNNDYKIHEEEERYNWVNKMLINCASLFLVTDNSAAAN